MKGDAATATNPSVAKEAHSGGSSRAKRSRTINAIAAANRVVINPIHRSSQTPFCNATNRYWNGSNSG
jgi:hypothetical protein